MLPQLIVFPASHIAIVTAVALAWLFSFPYRAWHKETHDLMIKLSEQDENYPRESDIVCITARELRRRVAKLPEVVQKYLSEVLFLQMHSKGVIDYDDERVIPIARTLRIDQEGTFLLDKKWVPFTATQEFSTCPRHPGFVWDAVMKTFMPINVRDAYVNGVGILKAQLPGGIPLMNMKDTDDLNVGELMRWLAEAVMFPMALIPDIKNKGEENSTNDSDKLKWLPSEEGCEDCAAAEIMHEGIAAKVHFHFDPATHMITKIHAMRPRIVNGISGSTHWEGYYYDYEIHGGVIVPTRMEVGWQSNPCEPVELYFRGKNSHFIYLMNNGERHTSHVVHAHAE